MLESIRLYPPMTINTWLAAADDVLADEMPVLSLRHGEDGGGVGGWRAASSRQTGGWTREGVRGGGADQVRGVPRANGVAMCLGGRWRTCR